MKCHDVVDAVKRVSGFWAAINELPKSRGRAERAAD
jgi:hypothetical protein